MYSYIVTEYNESSIILIKTIRTIFILFKDAHLYTQVTNPSHDAMSQVLIPDNMDQPQLTHRRMLSENKKMFFLAFGIKVNCFKF